MGGPLPAPGGPLGASCSPCLPLGGDNGSSPCYLTPPPSPCPNGIFYGDFEVLLSDPSDPLEGSTVTVSGPLQVSHVTNELGEVPLIPMKPDLYYVTASREGYKSKGNAVDLRDAPTVTCAWVQGFFLEKI